LWGFLRSPSFEGESTRVSCQPVFWAEEGCTNLLIFFFLYEKIHHYERVIDRINSGKEKKA
ncbi:MAG: hypothetical protein OEW18_11720, partial [Candidatus Aminicenantes bacterium]|nr:hypothetical protein [Candidatus Aminicenantes bacterium]